MAPVFSRISATPLPDDVLRMVASFLSPRDLKNLILSSRACHLAGAPVLYRSVEVWLAPLYHFSIHVHTIDNRPAKFLQTLINSSLATRSLSLPSRGYAAHLVTLCYGSWSMPGDFRALPLLAEALRFTHRLRHLRIDVQRDTVPVLLDIFRRASIIVTPSTTLVNSSPSDLYPLPCLQSIRSTRIGVADALMQHRAIKTVVVELTIKLGILAKFLRAEAPWNPNHLQQLSISVSGYLCPPGVLRSILTAFPRLRHLALHTTSGRASELMTDALDTLASVSTVGEFLHTFSVNHGTFYHKYGPIFKEFEGVIREAFRDRPVLKEVVMGGSLWSRKNAYTDWSFEPEFTYSLLALQWPWLEHQSQGEWGGLGEAVRAYSRDRDEEYLNALNVHA